MDIEDLDKLQLFTKDLIKLNPKNKDEFNKLKIKLRKTHKLNPSNRELSKLTTFGFLKIKQGRSQSGVLPVTVVMKPDKYSCRHDCKYCPDEPGIARSYLSKEPAVARGKEVNFDIFLQTMSRLYQLARNNHTIDKIEFILEGGTFSDYPKEYAKEVMRDLYYTINVWQNIDLSLSVNEQLLRTRKSLEEEITENTKNKTRVIGVCVETRPDRITWTELKRLREFNVTRIQIGIQHNDNSILELINRGHTYEQTVNAIKMIKDAGFKIDGHVMPDLPGSNPELDIKMMTTVLDELALDYCKIYPCLDVNYTEIRKWKEIGLWKPYAEKDNANQLIDVIVKTLTMMPVWTRVNRVHRDFPPSNEFGYNSETIKPNLHQLVLNEMEKRKLKCRCIRCREVKDHELDIKKAELLVRQFDNLGATEYFISIEDVEKDILYGFLRLRLNINDETQLKEIKNTALIRELHVYGYVTHHLNKQSGNPQHSGFGKQLMKKAEEIAQENLFTKIAVISGVGVREYYTKLGYTLDKTYMIKKF
jgi:ELP3 family radical SAM enzyme/protein acetyltransferase